MPNTPTNSRVTLDLPGIYQQIADAAKLQYADRRTALDRCGISEDGFLIPYYDIHGAPIMDQGGPFCRLRLSAPNKETGQKYHQRAGTRPHAYLPPNPKHLASEAAAIVIIEGEKKALSLADQKAIMPIGIGGFYSFKADGILVPEITSVLENSNANAMLYFYGDKDVIFNYQFSQAACALAELLHPRILSITCLPIDAPEKGIDDCKQSLGLNFYPFFLKTLVISIPIESGFNPATLAVQLLEMKVPSGWKPTPSGKEHIIRSFAKLAASLSANALEQRQVIEKAIATTDVMARVFNKMVKEIKIDRWNQNGPHELNSELTVDLDQQPAVWARKTLEFIGRSTFYFAGNICDYSAGKLEALTSASLVTRIDDPKCCSFIKTGANGAVTRKQLTERDTRIILGACRANQDVLRVVDLVSQVPVLAFTANGTRLINDYCPLTRILAAGKPVEISKPEIGKKILLALLSDFDFETPGDKGRAISMLLTLAMTKGGFLGTGRAPFFMIEKNTIGAGGGFLAKLTAAIHGVQPISITPDNPKEAREDISSSLLKGANFIYFDNIRGKILKQLPFFESMLTEPTFICRAPYLHGSAEVTRCVFACTSNGAVLSDDLADRAVRIGIRKKPVNYQFAQCGGLYVLDHVKAFQPMYLGSVFGLIKDWADKGRPPGKKLTGFRLPEWERACSWIIETHFPELSLLDDSHKESQKRMADPDFDLLRSVLRAVIVTGRTDYMSTTEIVRIAVNKNLFATDEQKEVHRMGRILSLCIPNEGEFLIAGEFRVTRMDSKEKETNYEPFKKYSIAPLQNPR